MRCNFKLSFIITLCLALTHCTSTRRDLGYVDTELDVKGEVNDKQVGIDEDDNVVLQEELDASQELEVQLAVNQYFERELTHEKNELQRCSKDLADPRLGGSGKLEQDTEAETKPLGNIKEEFGLNDKEQLKIVKTEEFYQRLEQERQYEKKLKQLLATFKNKKVQCEQKLASVRIEHGLPATRYQAEGYFTHDGQWVETRKGEKNLDDAFEITEQQRLKKEVH